jgi:ADP-heptose:LPS heptosyltransferase
VSTGTQAIESAARRLALLILRGIAGRRQGLPLLRPGDLRRVLLIRYDRIGDAVITTPLVAALKQAAPAVEIDVLASPGNRAIFQEDPRIANVIVWEGTIAGKLRAIRAARARRYDAVFQLLFSQTTLPALLSALMAPRGRTIGKRSPGHEALFNHAVATPVGHYGDRTLSLLPAGIALESDPGAVPYSLAIPERDRHEAARALTDAGLRHRDFILLNISAGTRDRELTIEQNIELAGRLRAHGMEVAIIGGPGVSGETRTIAGQSGAHPLGFSSLLAAAAAVGEAAMLVTPDTSMVHIGSAMGTPVVAMFPRGGDPFGWGPRGVPHRVIRAEHGERLSEIDLDAVAEAVEGLLRERGV